DAMATEPPKTVLTRRRATILLGLVLLVMVAALHQMLRLPGLPYNVVELFRGDGNPAALLAFAAATLWIGAGALLLSEQLLRPRAWLRLWPATLAICLTSLLLLILGVTEESVGDISGSNNLFWFVTNKDIWGVTMRELFLWLDAPGVISLLERCVRYPALYAPVPLFLALVWRFSDARRPTVRELWPLVLSLLALLWLCMKVAFNWSSTDNLNELIARHGPFGLRSGGIWLYALLLLICANAVFVARLQLGRLLAAAATSLALLPLSWWLLNQGLEAEVNKYGQTFSGAQFLLGPDRAHLLRPEILFARWALVYLGGVALLSLGLSLTRGLLQRQD
ncbi:MAG TPA: hypothetical protein VGE47_12265, partial [Burkholderiaceae bacterium]